jgi:hypothetical protein
LPIWQKFRETPGAVKVQKAELSRVGTTAGEVERISRDFAARQSLFGEVPQCAAGFAAGTMPAARDAR